MSLIDEYQIAQKRMLADKHYANYQKYYAEKNLSKASEFLWGTVEILINVIGLIYGRRLKNYRQSKDFLNDLILQSELVELEDQYDAAETLHANFYHNFLEEDDFEYKKEKVDKLVYNLLEIINQHYPD